MKLATSTLLFCLALGTAGVSAWDPAEDKRCRQFASTCKDFSIIDGYAYCKSKTWCQGGSVPCRKGCVDDISGDPYITDPEVVRHQCGILCNDSDVCTTQKPKGCGPL
ncbi:unnamed protein product [Tilletia controversa]|nr:unnamed protein product [Tilletia caries]CAD6972042.1 unnamed protein product [Tilletia controversa]CAD6980413.1 unnamed protein product [Tilletia controversa]